LFQNELSRIWGHQGKGLFCMSLTRLFHSMKLLLRIYRNFAPKERGRNLLDSRKRIWAIQEMVIIGKINWGGIWYQASLLHLQPNRSTTFFQSSWPRIAPTPSSSYLTRHFSTNRWKVIATLWRPVPF